ncbi:putative HTH-type transcriptional repressor ExuR [Abditibacteriota bacterium]|nr:putative HTH-type transcriptional repressor ExuR [Abditibacteriota bacterium]
MPVTQKDIARYTGLSRSTVAQVLTGLGHQAPETLEKVLNAARELGYRPNSLARALVTGKTQTIGFWYSPFINPVSMHLINGLDKQILPYKLSPINVWNRERSLSLPDEFPVAEWPVDGIIAHNIGHLPDWMWHEGRLNKPFVSLVYDAFPYRPGPEIDTILIQIRPGCQTAVEHLVKTRKRVALLCIESMPLYGDVRVQVYEKAMQAAGRPLETILTPLGQPLRLSTKQAVTAHVKAHGCPDAIFCGNDEQAIAAHGALQELGFRVPQDVALVGNDGLEEAAYHVPSLSTVALPIEEIVSVAWKFLQKRITRPDAPRQYAELKTSFLPRDSS